MPKECHHCGEIYRGPGACPRCGPQVTWSLMPADTDEQTARLQFEEKYGKAPDRLVHTRGGLLVGPIPTDHVRGG